MIHGEAESGLVSSAFTVCYSSSSIYLNTYNSGGIEASEAQVTMIPSTGLTEGQSVEFYLTLTNTLQIDTINVGYKFYKNQYSNNNKFVKT